jgi:hypothetical protein
LIDDFVPLPSFCQSLAYETRDRDDRIERFGKAKMRSVGPDDPKPLGTGIYERIGVFDSTQELSADPLSVPIPFHSHYLKSAYQDGPSPGDYDHLFHLKWLFTPKEGKNIIYSGITPFQIELPGRCELPGVDQTVAGAPNPEDAELWLFEPKGTRRFPIPAKGLSIGRAPGCDVILEDPDVSRVHARIAWNPLGALVLQDLGSRNGTLRAGEKVSSAEILEPCDALFGNTHAKIMF